MAHLADHARRTGPGRGRRSPAGTFDALAELPSPDHPGREIIDGRKRWMPEYLTDLAATVGLGEPDEVAAALLLPHEGVVVVNTAGTLDPAVEHAERAAARLIKAHTRARGR